MNDNDTTAYLRYHVTHLVRIWTALGMIRHIRGSPVVQVFKDSCSDKLRIMLHELAEKKRSMGFDSQGTDKHKRYFTRLTLANEWFTGTNGLHARNCSGAHLQPLPVAQHMFQLFGYGGEREWKKLTIGVAACLSMMKLIENHRHDVWWRELRQKIRKNENTTFNGLPVPLSAEALLMDFKLDQSAP